MIIVILFLTNLYQVNCHYYRNVIIFQIYYPFVTKVFQGTCFAQSAACMKEWQEKRDIGLNEYLSPQFFYNQRNYWNNNIGDGNDANESLWNDGKRCYAYFITYCGKKKSTLKII